MSLPTYATYFNRRDRVIATQFVNVGWWLTEDAFIEACMDLPWVQNTSYIMLYGIKIPGAVIEKPKTSEGFKAWKNAIITGAYKTIPEWNRHNADLREAVQKIYNEQKDKVKND